MTQFLKVNGQRYYFGVFCLFVFIFVLVWRFMSEESVLVSSDKTVFNSRITFHTSNPLFLCDVAAEVQWHSSRKLCFLFKITVSFQQSAYLVAFWWQNQQCYLSSSRFFGKQGIAQIYKNDLLHLILYIDIAPLHRTHVFCLFEPHPHKSSFLLD